ncbi:hypothetical protein SLS53_005287 [Cytospora paraplurivora]|uniref:Uncharacterized protein n=1 Tax=Cytospora paraplurivora TaxID=2898453 RepID=A0AAN9U5N7_9PEZI
MLKLLLSLIRTLVHNAYNKDGVADYDFILMTGWKQMGPISFADSKAIIADMRQRAEVLTEPFRSIINAIDDETKAWSGYLSYWPT